MISMVSLGWGERGQKEGGGDRGGGGGLEVGGTGGLYVWLVNSLLASSSVVPKIKVHWPIPSVFFKSACLVLYSADTEIQYRVAFNTSLKCYNVAHN